MRYSGRSAARRKAAKHRRVAAELDRIIAPMARRDHPAVEIEDALQLDALEADLASPVRGRRKGGVTVPIRRGSDLATLRA